MVQFSDFAATAAFVNSFVSSEITGSPDASNLGIPGTP